MTDSERCLNRSPKDSMQDIDKRSMIWRMFMSSTLEASVCMKKNYSDNLHSIKNPGCYLWLMMKKSSASHMQRFMYYQTLCYVLER